MNEINSPELLSQMLTATDTTDAQKVASIFNWITQNIAYNVKRYETNNNYRYAPVVDEEDEDTIAPLKPLYERIAILVLKRRTAVCSGYANLFKSLCLHAGIPCEVITGLGKASAGRTDKRFASNHRWNAVFFDTVWHLLDATWASGYINYKNEFQRDYNPNYFLTDPVEFIKDHYPEDMRWTLLPQPPVLNEFMYAPFKTMAFNRFYIKSYSPSFGIIEANVGDSIVFELEAVRPERLWISDLPYADSNTVFIMQCCGAVKPVNKVSGKKISYTYHVMSAEIEWLHVIFDDEIIMRYKLNVKRDEHLPASAPVDSLIQQKIN
ncbi:transglutaminase domain-containing protein [Panacibacter ginsenosidivorans]|uniref:transglutaminase domain-containing protein n=1 Tax=Panacibacter ginsenosidivorans TaxID=1813871 RepID=UPI0013152556|nr:transglutaminase domain-containing protein [Panacibacter ginsenosidivorans]